MEFNEQKALELKEKYNLSNSVINKWRFRNKIPEKYFKINDAEQKTLQILNERIAKILELGFINKAVLREITGVTKKKIYSKHLNKEEANKVKKELLQLKIDIAKAFKTKSEIEFKKIILDKRIFLKVILKDVDNLHYDRCIKFASKNTILENETYNIVKDKFALIALQINL